LKKGLLELPGNASITRALEKLEEQSQAEAQAEATDPPAADSLAYIVPFADYDNYVYLGNPSVPAYEVSPGLSNVVNYDQFRPEYNDWTTSFGYWHSGNGVTSEAVRLLEKNAFAVSDRWSYDEFFQIYEANRYNYVPNFITTDSAVHTFHLMFDYVLTDLEQNKLHGLLIKLSDGMAEASYAQYRELKGTSFESAALRNTAFFSVGSKLLNSGFSVPSEASELVGQELAFIEAHSGVTASPVISSSSSLGDYLADYSQYIPRSHYNQTEQLKAFFKSMMWYGQMTFRSASEDEVKSALLQTSALAGSELSELWANIFEPTNFFVGDCDDITHYQYASALKSVYGDGISQTSAVADESKFPEALSIIQRMEPPKINSVPILASQDKNRAATGYRFMGQRFTLDAYVFQNLIDRSVQGRDLPNSLDIPAAFGSEAAVALLADEVQAYPDYTGRLQEIRKEIQEIPASSWNSNLYWSWMHMLRPYAGNASKAGYPSFMQNQAWILKDLNTFQGSWTELKHDTLLYAKAATAEMGDIGEEPDKPDDRGYVEPNPDVFGRLASLVKQTRSGLERRGLLTSEAGEALGVLYGLSTKLTEIAEKELENQKLSDSDYEFIKTYGGELEHIWDTAKKYELSQTVNPSGEKYESTSGLASYYLDQHPCGVVADVATGQLALEEGTGFAKTIFVVFPRDGELVLGSGSVYSHYEFTVPISDRLTDEKWHELMRGNDLPEPAFWKAYFTVDIGQFRY
jgi:hypothetical protein